MLEIPIVNHRSGSGVRSGGGKPTIVDTLTDHIAFRIAAGTYPPGTLLPSVRQVAAEFGASTPSVNSAMGRLAALGFVEPRRGLGYVVRDISLYGGIDTWRYVLRFAHRLPDRVAKLFADVIDLDHILVMQAIRTIAADPRRYDLSPATRAVDRLELLTTDEHATLPDIMRAELDVLRCLFAAIGQLALLSLFNTVGEMLISIPEAGAAFYGPVEPAGHVLVCRKLGELAEAAGSAAPEDLDLVDSLIRTYHDQVVETFHELVGA